MAVTSPLYKTLPEPRMRGTLYTKNCVCRKYTLYIHKMGHIPLPLKLMGVLPLPPMGSAAVYKDGLALSVHTGALWAWQYKSPVEVMEWIITVLGMSICLLLPSLAVQGTLNISLVSHRIIKITDKKVLLTLLPANTKLLLVPFLILSAAWFYTSQMFWHVLLPVKNYSISYLITHTDKIDFS